MIGDVDRWLTGVLVALMVGVILCGIKAGCDEPKKPPVVPASTNAPLLIKLSPEDEVVSKTIPPPLGRVYPFKEPVTLNGFVSGFLVTNITDEVGFDANGLRISVTQYVTVTAKMAIQAPWENMMLQWNYDRPVDAQTNRYKLVR